MGNAKSTLEIEEAHRKKTLASMDAEWHAVQFEARCRKTICRVKEDYEHQKKVQRLRQHFRDFFEESEAFLKREGHY